MQPEIIPQPGSAPQQGAAEMGQAQGMSPESTAHLGHLTVEGPGEQGPLPEAVDGTPDSPAQLWEKVQSNMYYELQERVQADPTPTQAELQMGVYIQELEPQVRDAILTMRQKGYNTLSSGFDGEQHDVQSVALDTALSHTEAAMLEGHGFAVTNNAISFSPDNPTDLPSMKATWDFLAAALPDLGSSEEPWCVTPGAAAFRIAAESNTLLNFYMPNGLFDPTGTKNVQEYDPSKHQLGGSESIFSSDPVSALRETVFIDQYHELKNRLSTNPVPTAEEWNLGAYTEELEPQVRDAAISMRRKGYNTGSSGFYGEGHSDQVMDVATPIDDSTKARLADHKIEVTITGVRFTPEDPTNLDRIKKTWDMVADILPDLGKHADPAQNTSADVFRYATSHREYDDYLESWLWQAGALSDHMPALGITLYREGRDFGEDVDAPYRAAKARYFEMSMLAQPENQAADAPNNQAEQVRHQEMTRLAQLERERREQEARSVVR